MKKNLLLPISSLLITLAFFYSCQKETNQPLESESLAAKNDKPKNECRITAINGPGTDFKFLYNARGLNSEWDIPGFGTFKQEYDDDGQLKKSRWFIDDELVVTIVFTYDVHGRSIRDTWYYGNSEDIYDDVFHTRNARGLITRSESFVGDYYTDAIFTPEGNTSEWHYFIGGSPVYSGYLEYKEPHRNPYLAVHGIEYGFPFLNPTYSQQKWLAASEKLVAYDENNSPFIVFDYDPDKTIIQPGFQHYPASADFYDKQNNWWANFTYEYENCGTGGNSNKTNTRPAGINSLNGKQGIMSLLHRDPSMTAKEQLKIIRKQFKK